ncbi:MAG: hypothetical protein WCA49_10270 [Candidatus Sulfotelmatobacter sp.]
MRFSAVDRGCPQAGWAIVPLVVFVLTTSFSLTACSRQDAPPAPDASTLLQAVAPADPAKLATQEESKHWSNPYLIIRPQAVGLLSSVAANEEQILKPEEVLRSLAQLPASAWPYGRAVAVLVDAKPTSSEEDKIALRRNRGIVAGELQSAHVAITWIPSS